MKKQTERREKTEEETAQPSRSRPAESGSYVTCCAFFFFYSEAYCVAVLGVCVLFFIRRCCFVCLGYEPGCSHSSYIRQLENCGSATLTDGPRLPEQAEQISSVWVSPRMNSLITSHPKQSSHQEMRGQNNVYSPNAAVLKSTSQPHGRNRGVGFGGILSFSIR